MKYVWQTKAWPTLTWDGAALLPLVSRARLSQGKLVAQLNDLGFKHEQEAQAEILIEEAVETAAIEGEKLNRDSVRSSIAKRLGLSAKNLPPPNRAIDGLVDVLLDATQNFRKPLTAERLKRWQAALFPTGFSGLTRLRIGKWRGQAPMQVVSGGIGKEKVHFEAPPGNKVEAEMRQFLAWWKTTLGKEEGLIRAGLAHFYFVTVHPFEDGNGRIARALTDMALAQDEKMARRYYSLSSQIMAERNSYYDVLEKNQKGNGDVTGWLKWFLECHVRAVEGAGKLVLAVLAKANFWKQFDQHALNDRQRKVVNRLLDAGKGGFVGGMTTRKYASMGHVSRVTAYREISDLLEKKIFRQNKSKGRSVSYDLNWPEPKT